MRTLGAVSSSLTVIVFSLCTSSLQASSLSGSTQPAIVRGSDEPSGGDSPSGSAVANVLPSFAGIWLADGSEAMNLPAGCSLIVRVEAKAQQLIRAVICPNGNLQTDVAQVTAIGIEPSRFPGGFQFRTALGDSQSSCPDGLKSSVAGLSSLAFDLKTGAGGEAATFAYMQLGDVEVALHSAAALDLFDRSKACTAISKEAKDLADTPDNQLVKLAAKVCKIDAQPAGCFTADGYLAN